ncbi:MAG: polyprenol monophosphomannose synthase [Flavobacteriales bacterium]|jgi:dolichol-phosphate mannosyltransferase|nr:polyprenol monophosphomannose synthase [Flavobacteriales bacterium]
MKQNLNNKIVIIPTYNEKENVEGIIHKVFSFPTHYHILIVDDGSPDGTAEIVKGLQKTYPDRLHIKERKGKLGLGTAYLEGFQWSLDHGYDYIFEMDCDFSHNPDDLDRLLYQVEQTDADLAVGSRYMNNTLNVVNWPVGRVLMSFFASKYVKIILGVPIFDTTAGFKCYHRNVLEMIDFEKIKFIGYAFQIEMKYTAWKHGFKIVEVPVIFTDRINGVSKMSMKIFKEAVFGIWLLKWKSFFRKYKQKDA